MKHSSEFSDLLTSLEDLVRSGLGMEVRNRLKKVAPASIPRGLAADFSNLARRVGAINWGLRVLKPLVYGHLPGLVPSADELATYSALLIKVGVFGEARRLLQRPMDPTPLVHLFRGFCEIAQWNHSRAIPSLKSYLAVVADPYQRAMAQMNLAACYTSCGMLSSALPLVCDLNERSQQMNWALLNLNSIELLTRILALDPSIQIPKAQRRLIGSQGADSPANKGVYALFLRKWNLIRIVNESGFRVAHGAEFASLRRDAVQLRHFETVRDVDFYLALFRRDIDLARQVYFGTPHTSYRAELIQNFPDLRTAGRFLWNLDGSAGEDSRRLDVPSGLLDSVPIIKSGGISHKLLASLSSDFYRPQTVGTIFNFIHYNELYHPLHSPVRIYKSIQRLRALFATASVPLSIKIEKGEVSLTALSAFGILVNANQKSVHTAKERGDLQASYRRVSAQFQGRSFTSSQVAEALDLGHRSAQILLKGLKSRRKLRSIGKGRAARYLLAG